MQAAPAALRLGTLSVASMGKCVSGAGARLGVRTVCVSILALNLAQWHTLVLRNSGSPTKPGCSSNGRIDDSLTSLGWIILVTDYAAALAVKGGKLKQSTDS